MTAVPPVTFGANGFVAPSGESVLNGVIADYQTAFGGKLNLSLANPSSLSTPQGQLASSTAALVEQANDTFLYQSTQTDPAYAQGRWQDAIGRIYFIERIGAEPTVLQTVCTGSPGVSIPEGALIQDTSGNLYACTTAGEIQTGGTITLPFANQVTGPIAAPGTNDVSIYNAIPGWDSVTVASGELGVDTESRAAFEQRRAETVAGNSFGAIGSILGAVSKVSGVLDYWGYDNASGAPVTVQGVVIAANAIYITAFGGTDLDVAQAILSKKAPGCAYSGNTTVTAYDSNPLYVEPIPYDVTFERPDPLQILFAVSIVNGPTVPANAVTLIQGAIVSAFGGADGGLRARIGGVVYATRFVAPVAALGPWAQIRSLLIGSNNTPSATFTGSISGTTLSVSGVTGIIAIGQTVSGSGVGGTGAVAAGTTIVSGSGATWTVSISQICASQPMKSAVPNQNSVSVQGNQIPEIVADNIAVTVS